MKNYELAKRMEDTFQISFFGIKPYLSLSKGLHKVWPQVNEKTNVEIVNMDGEGINVFFPHRESDNSEFHIPKHFHIRLGKIWNIVIIDIDCVYIPETDTLYCGKILSSTGG